MLSWIPLVGPILQGLFNTASGIYSKFKDTQVDLRKQDVAEAQVSAQIIRDTNDDIGIRIMRDALCVGPVAWTMLGSWDTIMAIRYPWLMFHVEKYPDSMAYLPYAVVCFLLGNIGLNMWNRKR
jgi:hypothetical protein